ncbi:hypothetical protein B0I35DRAFT_71582 [Stachybotrys elegans]|uniref:Uncharacterized protein n=1 Tax=Stachybotrys elegans TaxID=80388 RepID=A0A8K0SQ07_9HYPO|nr:hypothetical protein B0I35DRAFT_71582 [Stachybotrys elegans]
MADGSRISGMSLDEIMHCIEARAAKMSPLDSARFSNSMYTSPVSGLEAYLGMAQATSHATPTGASDPAQEGPGTKRNKYKENTTALTASVNGSNTPNLTSSTPAATGMSSVGGLPAQDAAWTTPDSRGPSAQMTTLDVAPAGTSYAEIAISTTAAVGQPTETVNDTVSQILAMMREDDSRAERQAERQAERKMEIYKLMLAKSGTQGSEKN